ncbi:MAG: GNAT family N-acetyltransferase [Sutterella sp.]|uniref:GNAT family N-acetyltransferase n=1 Tax=Dakarella massiliensis TaxID=1506471 RepID=UPI000A4466B9|nr:GNAT family N-acetyltransferase [Dakarella massiliensis]MBS6156809.1 GNAT family N-acetyltransferase [Sutterella sp.]
MTIEIRSALPSDLDAIAAAEAESFPAAEAATRESFESRLTAYGNHFWLLFVDGELASFVDGLVTNDPDLKDEMYEDASMHDESGAWQMIFGVVTRPRYRKQGYAGELLKRMIAEARKEGRKGLVLTCKDPLVHYYAKFGFVNEGFLGSTRGGVTWNQMRITF